MAQAHDVAAAVPLVEVAHHRNPRRIRRPHRKAGAGHVIDLHGTRAQAVGQLAVTTFLQQMQIQLAQQQAESIGVFGLLHAAAAIGDRQSTSST
jgi:hypothetical protein